MKKGNVRQQGAKKIILQASCKMIFTSPDVISTTPRYFLMSRIDFIVLICYLKMLKKCYLPDRQVNNRIH